VESYDEIVFSEPSEALFARICNHPAVVVSGSPSSISAPSGLLSDLSPIWQRSTFLQLDGAHMGKSYVVTNLLLNQAIFLNVYYGCVFWNTFPACSPDSLSVSSHDTHLVRSLVEALLKLGTLPWTFIHHNVCCIVCAT
jgi:hypothetical protein